MLRHLLVACALAFATLARAQAPELPPEAREAMAVANRMLQAALKDDYTTVVQFTYAPAINQMGGREQALAQTQAAMRDARERGYAYTEYVLETPTPLHRVERRLYIAIPTRFILNSPQGKLAGRSYLLGISDDRGTTWTFADGAGLTDPARRITLFSDLPPELVLPPVEAPHPQ